MSDIKFVVSVDSANGKAQIRELEGELGKLAKTTKVAGDEAKGSQVPFAGMFGEFTKGLIAANLIEGAFGAIKGALVDSVKGAIDQEKAEANLVSALVTTGRTVEGNREHYLDFALAQQKATLYTDEQIEASQALLLQLTHLGQDGIDRATRGAIGLAAALDMDLHSATMMVTKAMEGNYTALGKVGIKIQENLSPQEKQNELLRQLDGLYGRATAQAETAGGKLEQMKKAIDENKEAFGTLILHGLTPFVKIIGDAATLINDLITAEDKAGAAAKRNDDSINNLALRLWKAAEAADKSGSTWLKMRAAFTDIIQPTVDYTGKMHGLTSEIDGNKSSFVTHWEAMRRAIMNDEYGAQVKAEFIKLTRLMTEENKKEAAAFVDKAKATVDAGKLVETAIGMNRISFEKWGSIVAHDAGVLDLLGTTAISAQKRFYLLDGQIRLITESTKHLETPLERIGSTLEDDIPAAFLKTTFAFVNGGKVATGAAKKSAEDIRNAFMDALAALTGLFGNLGSLYQANADAEIASMDRGYEWRKKLIENSLLSEEEKQKKIAELDKEYAEKKKAVQHEVAVKQRNSAIIEATINGAVAFTKALTAAPPPWNFVLAAMSLASATLQIMAIKAQPIPLAGGGIIDRPTLSPGGGALYGEAGPEAVIPISNRAKRRAQLALEGDSNAGARPIYHLHFEIGGREVGGFIIDTVQDAGERGSFEARGLEVPLKNTRILWNNLWRKGTLLSATTESPQYPAAYTQDDDTTLAWRSTSVGAAQDIVVDLLAASEYNVISILNHNITAGATITLYGADDSGFTTNLVSDVVTYNGNNLRFYLAASRTKRFVRLRVLDTGNAAGYIQIGTVALGKYLDLGVVVSGDGYEDGFSDTTQLEYSPGRNLFITQVQPVLISRPLTHTHLSDGTKALILQMLKEVGNHYAIDICLDYADPNNYSTWAVIVDVTRLKYVHVSHWAWSIEILEHL